MMKLPDFCADSRTDKQARWVAALMGRLKNAKKQTEGLDSISIGEAYHKPQNVTLFPRKTATVGPEKPRQRLEDRGRSDPTPVGSRGESGWPSWDQDWNLEGRVPALQLQTPAGPT